MRLYRIVRILAPSTTVMSIDVGLEHDISDFLGKDSTVTAMVEASKRGRPAVEAIGGQLLDCFGDRVRPNTTKQCIGRLIRPLMEAEGYSPAGRRRPARSALFTSGTVYSRPIMGILRSHGVDLPPDDVSREVLSAIDTVAGISPHAMPHTHFAWSQQPRIAEVPPTGLLRVFATAIEQALEQADQRSETAVPDSQLTAAQLSLLHRATPALSLTASPMHRRVSTAFKYGALWATSLTAAQTARLLHYHGRWVHACIRERRLYSLAFVRDEVGRLPLFQLHHPGRLVPHVTEVFPQLDDTIHPVGVFNWFTSPNPDLATRSTGFKPISPRDWLLHEYPPNPVTQLAAALAGGNPA